MSITHPKKYSQTSLAFTWLVFVTSGNFLQDKKQHNIVLTDHSV